MNQPISNVVPAEVFSRSDVASGQVICPCRARLLDLLNGRYVDRSGQSDFVEFEESSSSLPSGSSSGTRTEHVRKQAIELLALSDPDLCRGQGAADNNVYPYKAKKPIWVKVRMHGYTLTGRMYCSQGQTIGDVLAEDCTFLPLTEATIASRNYVYGSRPFVAVNKSEIISSSAIDRPASARQLMESS